MAGIRCSRQFANFKNIGSFHSSVLKKRTIPLSQSKISLCLSFWNNNLKSRTCTSGRVPFLANGDPSLAEGQSRAKEMPGSDDWCQRCSGVVVVDRSTAPCHWPWSGRRYLFPPPIPLPFLRISLSLPRFRFACPLLHLFTESVAVQSSEKLSTAC